MAGRAAAARRAVQLARRYTPVAIELYRRWDKLPPDEKARHRERALKVAERVRDASRAARGQSIPRKRT